MMKSLLIGFLFALVCVVSSVTCADVTAQYEEQFESGYSDSTIAHSNDDKQTKLKLAEGYKKAGDWDKAIEAYQSLIKEYPDEADEYWLEIADCHYNKKDDETPINIYKALTDGSPTIAMKAWFHLGWCYQQRWEWANAISAYKAVLTSAPKGTAKDDYYIQYAKVHIAECYSDTSELDKSIAYYLSVAEDCPDNAGNYKLDAAEKYIIKEDYNSAIIVCKNVVENHPEVIDRALLLMGKCLKAQNKSGEAKQKFNEALSYLENLYAGDSDKQVDILIRMADAYDRVLMDYPGTIDILNRLINAHSDAPQAIDAELRIASLTLFGVRDMSSARMMLQDFMKKHPDHESVIKAAYNLAQCSYMESNWAEAAALFADVRNYKETSNYYATSLYMAADCYSRVEEFEKAKKNIDNLIATYPNDCWTKLAIDRYADLTGANKKPKQ